MDNNEQAFKSWRIAQAKGKTKGRQADYRDINTIKNFLIDDRYHLVCKTKSDTYDYGPIDSNIVPSLYDINDISVIDKLINVVKRIKPNNISDDLYKTHISALNNYKDFLENQGKSDLIESSSTDSDSVIACSRNQIWFGAPGTGKSYKLNELLQEYFPNRYERVTFYADYLHSQFVGSYKPVMVLGKDKEDKDIRQIEYQFRPGPFTRVLVRALNDPSNNYALVIEELNRAEAASVFGDAFQLLDRDESGRSVYAITVSEDLREYLNATDEKDKNHLSGNGLETLEFLTEQSDCSQIVIPKNMYILATMNSADQGVFPLDTAFKRRWDFEYVGIDDGDNAKDENGGYIIKDRDWVTDYRKTINRNLLAAGIPEDKQMGPFFLGKPSLSFGEKDFDKAMRNKVIMYLFEDAAKYNFADVFNTDAIRNTLGASEEVKHFSLSELFTAWDNIKYGMFQGLQSKPRVQATENKNSTPVSDSDKSPEDNQEPASADRPEQESGE